MTSCSVRRRFLWREFSNTAACGRGKRRQNEFVYNVAKKPSHITFALAWFRLKRVGCLRPRKRGYDRNGKVCRDQEVGNYVWLR